MDLYHRYNTISAQYTPGANTASSPTDIWAVGAFTSDGGHQGRALVEHWNGKQWTNVSVTQFNGTLRTVVALAPNNVWAAGTDMGALLHWNGVQWQLVPIINPDKDMFGEPFISGFAADPTSPGALWLAGEYALPGSIRQGLIKQILIETDMP